MRFTQIKFPYILHALSATLQTGKTTAIHLITITITIFTRFRRGRFRRGRFRRRRFRRGGHLHRWWIAVPVDKLQRYGGVGTGIERRWTLQGRCGSVAVAQEEGRRH